MKDVEKAFSTFGHLRSLSFAARRDGSLREHRSVKRLQVPFYARLLSAIWLYTTPNTTPTTYPVKKA